MEGKTLCIVGDFSGDPDEGAKNVAFSLSEELSKKCSITRINEKRILSREFFSSVLHSDKPSVIHYFTDPTLSSLLFLKFLSVYWRGSKTVVSALHPDISPGSGYVGSLLKPDLILTQSDPDSLFFQGLRFNVQLLPNGVDLKKFRPAPDSERARIREKYGIPSDQFLVLHVGHIKENRHLEVFGQISEEKTTVLIVASRYITVNPEIYQELTASGIIVKTGFIEDINDIYSISDCYVFPVDDNGAITTPLSVLEAMATNLPVVTRKFSGLEFLFSERDGFYYADRDEEFIGKVELIKKGVPTNTRDMVSEYSWENITDRLTGIYRDLLDSNGGSR